MALAPGACTSGVLPTKETWPEGSWGLFPYVVYQRFQAAAPEFEQMAAFQAGRDARAPEVLDYWRTLLPQRFYVELQRLGRPGESAYLGRAVELAA